MLRRAYAHCAPGDRSARPRRYEESSTKMLRVSVQARLLVGHEKRKVSSGCRVHGIEDERWRNELFLSPTAFNPVSLRELNVWAVPARSGSALLYLP